MNERIAWKGGALLAPVPPAIVTCGVGDGVNALTVAWTGILATKPPTTYISVRPTRHSYGLIKEHGEFVINLCSSDMARAVDYCGMYTGAKQNKLQRLHLETEPSEKVSTPTLSLAPLSLECRVKSCVPLGSHDMFIAEIEAITLHSRLLDSKGALHLERANLLAYAHGHYYGLGKQLGAFGFSATRRSHRAPHGKRQK